jgi:hypothetical protein
MYTFLFALVPLAIAAVWALVHDPKRRHRHHAHGADIQLRIRAARESASERAAKWTKWMLCVLLALSLVHAPLAAPPSGCRPGDA